MSATRVTLFPNDDYNRKPTAEELATVPAMTRDEAREVMRSEEYKTSSLVRELVKASLAKSGDLSPQAGTRFDGSPQEPRQTGDEVLAKRETVAAMMRDPRYKNDPLYRLEVSQKIANLTAGDNAGISADDLKRTNQSVSLGISTSPYHGAALAVRRFHRVELEPTLTGPDAPAKPSKPSREPFSSK